MLLIFGLEKFQSQTPKHADYFPIHYTINTCARGGLETFQTKNASIVSWVSLLLGGQRLG